MDETSDDAFLGGRLQLLQPARGYRAGTDPLLLAACVTPPSGSRVLDVGCGVGTALLALGRRVPGLVLHGLEYDPFLADLAAQNAARNGLVATIHQGDLAAPPLALRDLGFDLVLSNPPWHEERTQPSPHPQRDRAHRETALDTRAWVLACLRRVKSGGTLAIIQRAERLGAILSALEGRCGDIHVLPLTVAADTPAKRVIVWARKDRRSPLRLLPPLITHDADGQFRPEIEAVLRHAAALGRIDT